MPTFHENLYTISLTLKAGFIIRLVVRIIIVYLKLLNKIVYLDVFSGRAFDSAIFLFDMGRNWFVDDISFKQNFIAVYALNGNACGFVIAIKPNAFDMMPNMRLQFFLLTIHMGCIYCCGRKHNFVFKSPH